MNIDGKENFSRPQAMFYSIPISDVNFKRTCYIVTWKSDEAKVSFSYPLFYVDSLKSHPDISEMPN